MKTVTILSGVHDSSPAPEICYALIELSHAQLRWLLDEMDRIVRIKAQHRCGSVLGIEYWDCPCTWISDMTPLEQLKGGDVLIETVDNNGLAEIILDGVEIEQDSYIRIDMETVHIQDDEVYWEGCHKHTDACVVTRRLTKSERVRLGGGMPRQVWRLAPPRSASTITTRRPCSAR